MKADNLGVKDMKGDNSREIIIVLKAITLI